MSKLLLTELLALCTVRISPLRSLGTGFFVAPGQILTCEHVIQDVKEGQPVPVFWQGQEYQARIQQTFKNPYPDLALLTIAELEGKHPCVWLDATKPDLHGDLFTYGYRADYPEGSPSTFEFEDMARGSQPLLTFKLGDVQKGQSGSPLLNLKTGGICGIIPVSREPNSLLGGRAVPTEIIFQYFPELTEAQRQFHALDQRWQQAKEDLVRTAQTSPVDLIAVAQQYRNALLRSPSMTKIQVLRMNTGIPLDNLYIRLRLSLRSEQDRRSEPDDVSALHDPTVVYERRQQLLERRFSTSFEPARVLRQFRHCVFLGEPGAGKTTLLKYLIGQFLQPEMGRPVLVPIYIQLSEFARANTLDLTAFAAHDLAQRFQLDENALLTYFRHLITHQQALFLLDALDEVASAPTYYANANDYPRIVDAIENLAEHCDYIVLTARRAGYHLRRIPRVFTELEVLDFRRPDIEQFIEKWFRERKPAGWQNKIEEFKMRLHNEKNTPLLTLTANPLLLTQLALLFEINGDLPERRFNIYKDCTELVQRRWDNERGVPRSYDLGMEEEFRLLRELAWSLHSQRGRALDARACQPLIANLLRALNRTDLTPSQALQALSDARGLLRDLGSEQYEFVHFTFQEYFAAQHIKEANSEQTLLPFLGDPWWEEVILLYVGAANDASSLLACLLTTEEPGVSPEDIFLSKLILAGRCLAERPTVLKNELRQQIIDRLFAELEIAEYRFLRQHLANTLTEIGRATPGGRAKDDPVNQRLLAYLYTSEGPFLPSLELQCTILKSLGASGSSTLIPALLDLLIQFAATAKTEIYTVLDETIQYLAQPDETLYLRLFDLARNPQTEQKLAASAAYLLASAGTMASTTSLLAEVRNPNLGAHVSSGFAWSIAMLGDDRTLEELLLFTGQESQNLSLFADVLYGIRMRRLTSAIPTLLRFLTDEKESSDIRFQILSIFRDVGTLSTVTSLFPLLRDTSQPSGVRGECAFVCAALGGQLHRQELLSLASNRAEDEWVRQTLALGFAETADEELRAPLYKLYLTEPTGNVRNTLVIALSLLGEAAVFHELQTLWDASFDVLLGYSRQISMVLARLLDLPAKAR